MSILYNVSMDIVDYSKKHMKTRKFKRAAEALFVTEKYDEAQLAFAQRFGDKNGNKKFTVLKIKSYKEIEDRLWKAGEYAKLHRNFIEQYTHKYKVLGKKLSKKIGTMEGTRQFNKKLNYHRKHNDILFEKGKASAMAHRFSYSTKKVTRKTLITASLLVCVPITAFTIANNISAVGVLQQNAAAYSNEIKNYKESVKNFAKEIEDLQLKDDFSKIEAIKVKLYEYGVDGQTFAYGEDSDEVSGFAGLSVLEGQGVCRNMASFEKDVATELGIKCEVVTCQAPFEIASAQLAEGKDGLTLSDIKRKRASAPERTEEETARRGEEPPATKPDSAKEETPLWEWKTKLMGMLIGNHAIVRYPSVSAINDKGEMQNIKGLYSDITNPSLLVREFGTNNLVSLNSGESFAYTLTPILDIDGYKFNNLITEPIVMFAEGLLEGHSRAEIDNMKQLMGTAAQNSIISSIREKLDAVSVPSVPKNPATGKGPVK